MWKTKKWRMDGAVRRRLREFSRLMHNQKVNPPKTAARRTLDEYSEQIQLSMAMIDVWAALGVPVSEGAFYNRHNAFNALNSLRLELEEAIAEQNTDEIVRACGCMGVLLTNIIDAYGPCGFAVTAGRVRVDPEIEEEIVLARRRTKWYWRLWHRFNRNFDAFGPFYFLFLIILLLGIAFGVLIGRQHF